MSERGSSQIDGEADSDDFGPCESSDSLADTSVPVALGATLVQSSLYDVPGGYRAVLFDRFSGVKPNVS
jgi:hypothetical protein